MSTKKLKILHLGFHKGLENELYSVADELKVDLVFKRFQDGVSKGSAIYSVGHDKAVKAWEIFKDYYMKFDIIITSDTAPISRVFLQNNWDNYPNKKLIIWVCNRFDYFDRASKDCLFPDREYFDLIRSINSRKNVHIMGYTKFENYYAKYMKRVNFGNDITRPIGMLSKKVWNYKSQPDREINDKKIKNMFFVPSYHNDTIFMNLSAQLDRLEISNYTGRYNGPLELRDFKGVIHIPYAWSNLALFEAFQLGIIYFIPSKKLIETFARKGKFFWSPPLDIKLFHLSEWYDPRHEDLFIFFDSWSDLKKKVEITNYEEQRKKILEFGKKHKKETLSKWKKLLNI